MAQSIWHTIKVKGYSIIKFTYQDQQKNLHNLQKQMIGLMRVSIVMINQDISLICHILKILNILTMDIYLMLPPLIMVKVILTMKVVNLLRN